MLKYGGKGISARPSALGTWPINSPFSGPQFLLARRSSLRSDDPNLWCWGFLESFAHCPTVPWLLPQRVQERGSGLCPSAAHQLCILAHLLA